MAGIGLTDLLRAQVSHDGAHEKKAVKCDLCKDSDGGPACVSACPTGAAIRIEPEAYIAWVRGKSP
jgi:Fe-S-cluster-containing hydrogenase component 2